VGTVNERYSFLQIIRTFGSRKEIRVHAFKRLILNVNQFLLREGSLERLLVVSE
jgi:hypothetical protein